MAWNRKEAIVESALTRGVLLCHSLEKVSTISLMVNTPQPCYLLPPSLSISVSLCLCILFASVVLLAYVQSSLLSFSLHYSLKMGCHRHWWLRISISPLSPPPTPVRGHPAQQSRQDGVMWHAYVFVSLIWEMELFQCSHKNLWAVISGNKSHLPVRDPSKSAKRRSRRENEGCF